MVGQIPSGKGGAGSFWLETGCPHSAVLVDRPGEWDTELPTHTLLFTTVVDLKVDSFLILKYFWDE